MTWRVGAGGYCVDGGRNGVHHGRSQISNSMSHLLSAPAASLSRADTPPLPLITLWRRDTATAITNYRALGVFLAPSNAVTWHPGCRRAPAVRAAPRRGIPEVYWVYFTLRNTIPLQKGGGIDYTRQPRFPLRAAFVTARERMARATDGPWPHSKALLACSS